MSLSEESKNALGLKHRHFQECPTAKAIERLASDEEIIEAPCTCPYRKYPDEE